MLFAFIYLSQLGMTQYYVFPPVAIFLNVKLAESVNAAEKKRLQVFPLITKHKCKTTHTQTLADRQTEQHCDTPYYR